MSENIPEAKKVAANEYFPSCWKPTCDYRTKIASRRTQRIAPQCHDETTALDEIIADDEYVTATREVTAAGTTDDDDNGSLPVYQLHYAVFYNASSSSTAEPETANLTSTIVPGGGDAGGDEKASNACARHYAETFLIRLFTLQAWLNELCSGQQRQRSVGHRVVIHTIVVVRVYGPLVCIFVNPRSRAVTRAADEGGGSHSPLYETWIYSDTENF